MNANERYRRPFGELLCSRVARKATWWGTMFATLVICAATTITLHAQGLFTVHNFDGTDGSEPAQGLVQGADGNLYGATQYGGANNYGTVFKITHAGVVTTLHTFDSTDGYFPWPLVQGADGNFYGTTYSGGGSTSCPYGGCGTVFKITPSGALTTLHIFCAEAGCSDGSGPYLGLILGNDGNFYGTTTLGGASGEGTVFRITPGGTLTTLYSFCSRSGCSDGFLPSAALVLGADGNFYGTTSYSGTGSPYPGTVFKITPKGFLTTLYTFCSQPNCTDGTQPISLVQGVDGNFYGATQYGGVYPPSCPVPYGCGTVFKLTPSGKSTTLYSFCSQSGCADGIDPYGLTQGTDGNFYGTTSTGGSGSGTVFSITPSGKLTTLVNFDGTNGADPYLGGLVQDTNGRFYGTTLQGGASGYGTVFGFAVAGLGPFVETRPASGKVGTTVRILGTNLSGATGVTFNGTAATFKVDSGSLISTTVPVGATAGAVQVTTPQGTLSSNVVFRVGH